MRMVSQAKLKNRRWFKWTIKAGAVLAAPLYWASSKKTLIRANIKPPVELVELVVDDLVY